MFDVGVCSIGGVGSSMFIDWLNRLGLATNANHFHVGTSPYKHASTPDVFEGYTDKTIFIYGDPINAFLSLADGENGYVNDTHKINRGLTVILPKQTINDCLSNFEDPYKVYDQIHHWMCDDRSHVTMMLRYEDLWSETTQKEIQSFLNLTDSEMSTFPPHKDRKSRAHELDEAVKWSLEKIYGHAYTIIESLAQVTYTKGYSHENSVMFLGSAEVCLGLFK